MVQRPTMGNLTHKHTIVQICKALVGDKGYIKMAKCPKTPSREYQKNSILSSYKSYNIVGS